MGIQKAKAAHAAKVNKTQHKKATAPAKAKK